MPKSTPTENRSIDQEFLSLFSKPDVVEPQIQSFLELHSELIPTPSLLGHNLHFNCIITKLKIADGRIPDFVYLTRNSAFCRLVLIELERPQKAIFVKSDRAQFHNETHAAIAQIDDWKIRIESHPESIRQKLAPLVYPEWMRNQAFEVAHVLLIGRNPNGRFTAEQNSAIRTLHKEKGISLITYDSILRMYQSRSFNVGHAKDILARSREKFELKHRHLDHTGLFCHLSPDDLAVTQEQVEYYRSAGFDMDAWLKYELLTVNLRYPSRRSNELTRKMIDGITNPDSRRKKLAR